MVPGESFVDDTSNNPRPIQQRRRIRDASARYRRLYSNPQRPMEQNLRSNYEYNNNQHAVSRTHQTSDGSYYQQLSSPSHNTNASNRVYNNELVQEPSDQLLIPYFSGSRAINPKTISQSSSSERYEVDDFNAHSRIQRDWEHSLHLDHTRTNNSDQAMFVHCKNSHQTGIKRFQKPENDYQDFLFLDAEGGNNDLFGQNSEIVDYAGVDDFSDSNPDVIETRHRVTVNGDSIFQRREPQLNFLEAIEHTNNRSGSNEHEFDSTLFEQHRQNPTSKLQLDPAVPENNLTRRLSDITNESNLLGGSSLQSQGEGISRFKRRRDESTFGKDYERSPSRHPQSNETILEHNILSDGLNCQVTSSPERLRFFNDENEVDISGTPLNVSMATERIQRFIKFGTQQINNRDDVNRNERSSIRTDNLPVYGSNNIDEAKLRQTSSSSPDTNYLRGTSFGNESMWNFFR